MTGARKRTWASCLPLALFALAGQAEAGIVHFGSETFTTVHVGPTDIVVTGPELIFTGPNDGSGLPGTADLVTTARDTGVVSLRYLFTAPPDPDTGEIFDWAGYIVGNEYTRFSPLLFDTPLPFSFDVVAGQTYGFRIETDDNGGEPGILTISDFSAPGPVPEPGSAVLVLIAAGCGILYRRIRRLRTATARALCCVIAGLALCSAAAAQDAYGQYYYPGTNATGLLKLSGVTNVSQLASTTSTLFAPARLRALQASAPEYNPRVRRPHRPAATALRSSTLGFAATATSITQGLSVTTSPSDFSFAGLNHGDQRSANNGNQFSTEPPSQDIAVGNGYVLEGVNNAIQVYSISGSPMLAKVLSSNELFGVAPEIDRTTFIYGVYTTDMRVFYDQGLNRWFVLQRAQDYDLAGNPLPSSRLYLAVSRTGDPLGSYNIYVMDTTNGGRQGCPCVADFPQIAADQFGVYISFDLYEWYYFDPHGASILAISKASLASDSDFPVVQEFAVPRLTGYETTIRPAITPPNASYFLASGGVEFFLSTYALGSGSQFSLWALVNTGSLATTPDLKLIQRIIPGMSYSWPDVAAQRPGPIPYGSTEYGAVIPPFIDGGRDCRILSLVYAGGRLYATFATQATDVTSRRVVAGGYAILSPTFRSGRIAAPVLRSGYLVVDNNHVLRPAVAVNPQGKGAVVFTVAGPDYYPSAAFVPIDTFSTGTTARIVCVGVAPEDGFTGYDPPTGIARWGDYSSAFAAADGSIWMAGQYIPNVLRIPSSPNWAAHWGTRIARYVP